MNTYRVYLKAQSAAASSGPNFNVVPDVGAATPSQITKTQLLSGVIITVDQAATTLNLISVGGTCTDSFNVAIQKDPASCLPAGDPAYPTTPTPTPAPEPSITQTPVPFVEPTPCPPPPPPPSPTPTRPPIQEPIITGGCCDPFFTIAKSSPLPALSDSLSNTVDIPPAGGGGGGGAVVPSDEQRFIALWEDNGPDAVKEMATLIYKNDDGTDLWIFHKNKLVPSIGGCVIQYVRVWMNGVEHLYVAGSLPNANTVVQYGPIILDISQVYDDRAGDFLELGISWDSIPGGLKTLSGGFGLVIKRASLNENFHWRSEIGVTVDGFTEAGKPWGVTRKHLEALTRLKPSSLALPEDPFPMPSPAIDRDGDGIDEDLIISNLTDSELADLLETRLNLTDTCEATFSRITNTSLPGFSPRPPRPDDPMDDPVGNYIIGPKQAGKSLKDRVQLYIDPLHLSGS